MFTGKIRVLASAINCNPNILWLQFNVSLLKSQKLWRLIPSLCRWFWCFIFMFSIHITCLTVWSDPRFGLHFSLRKTLTCWDSQINGRSEHWCKKPSSAKKTSRKGAGFFTAMRRDRDAGMVPAKVQNDYWLIINHSISMVNWQSY